MKQIFIKTRGRAKRLITPFMFYHLLMAILLIHSASSQAQSPGGVTGAMVWLKANSISNSTTNGSTINSWTSQPGSKNFTGAATYYDEVNKLANFNPVVNFNGSTDLFINNTVFGADAVSANSTFIAAKILGNSSSLTSVLWGSSDNSAVRLNVHFPNGNVVYYDMGNAFGGRISHAMTPGDYNTNSLWTFRTGTTAIPAFNHQIFKSGTSVVTTNSGIPSYSLLGKDLRIGSSIGNTQPWNGDMFELIVYEEDLTTLQRQQVETYLAIKYGKTLPYDYVSSDGVTIPYTVAGYGHNIAGVGRDDISQLLQKQSLSSNPGPQVMMSLNGLPQASNALNAGAVGFDRRYIIWGDDNATGTTGVSGITNINNRFSKWWKLENAGSISQAVTLLYPVSELAAYSTPYVLRSSTATTASASIIALNTTIVTVNGVDYYSVPIQWATGTTYFTFAGCVPLATAVTTVTQPTCAVVSGTVTISNPVAGQTYSFDNGATYQASNVKSGLAPGVYQVIIKDACTTSAATSVTVNVVPATCCEPAAGSITLNP
ncbi:hypothetical protein [Dyadobacter psychrotolerans]|uniref:DUF8202 domain-containing protein n=1 Tax=Dyadobacter psychrotolerans TaxID=2541721 RepID=A0A4R5DGI9_9BACT|nr:hypothetical protein [Dyadobacter psychrotolerans]TDE12327.1 hypothetical protein E0F88_21740 [Dyadobacter psychrotolerans]